MSDGPTPSVRPEPGTTAWRLWKRIFVAVALGGGLIWFAQPTSGDRSDQTAAQSGPAPLAVAIKTPEDVASATDPSILLSAGKHWLDNGNKTLAKSCFVRALKIDEINHYSRFGKSSYAKAIVAELMGDYTASRVIWRDRIKHDVTSTFFYLVRYSVDPKKGALIAEAKARVSGLVKAVENGETPHVYTTRKGKKRTLKLVSGEEAIDAFRTGKKLRYAYIQKVDLTKQTFTGRVSCTRCIIGSLDAYGSTFQGQVDFTRNIFVDRAHFGKKWTGKVNKSPTIPAGQFHRLLLNNSVFLGESDFDSLKVTGKTINLPLTTFMKDVDLRNIRVEGITELRYATILGSLKMKRARLLGSAYFGHVHAKNLDLTRLEVDNQILYFNSAKFSGEVKVEGTLLRHGVTFEDTYFGAAVVFRNGKFDRLTNFSRAHFAQPFQFEHMKVTDFLALGTVFSAPSRFNDSVFYGTARFALDALTRRENLANPTPLHTVYKRYQGDDDAETKLTDTSQYGVRSVNDLIAQFKAPVSFANATFSKAVTFERVHFGSSRNDHINFFNTQFEGESHFEHGVFVGLADFRTISANEISFNGARFGATWMLDDANVRGRLSLTEAHFGNQASISTYGADISSFGIELSQLVKDPDHAWQSEGFRLFYLQCLLKGEDNKDYWSDSRLTDARWNARLEKEITNKDIVKDNVERMCINRAIGEFTLLRDSFSSRSMLDESDWAYWHLKHYRNHRTNRYASNILIKAASFLNWIIFEKAFGWGVLLHNLLITLLVTVVLFVFLHYWLCGDMVVIWDGERYQYRDLPIMAMLLLSTSAFLVDSGLSAALVPEAKKWWKYLYTAEVAVGIIVVTFFIGAYTDSSWLAKGRLQ